MELSKFIICLVSGILMIAASFAFMPYIIPPSAPSYLTIWYWLFPLGMAVVIVVVLLKGLT
jgi:hypothetical protein